jgi:hypothetical protein
MKIIRLAVLLACVATPVRGWAADGSSTAARDLYASAAYDDALTMLNGLAVSAKADDRQSIDLYRTLCLVALGRTGDADKAIETMIQRDPLFHASSDDISPKLQSAFTEARKRMLPSIIQRQYADAKAAFDKQDWPAATAGFSMVLKGLADPDVTALAGAPPLSDLKTLATGFRDLSVKNTPPPPPPPVAKPAYPVKAVYGPEDSYVMPPVTVQQKVPRYPGNVFKETSGIVEYTIDETGAVVAPLVKMSIDNNYDSLLLAAVKKFQYQPATLDVKPVKYSKRLTITVSPTPQQ